MKLFKRSDKPGSPYYCKFSVKRRQYLWSTKTDNSEKAKRRAKDYRQQVLAEAFHLVDSMRERSSVPTFAELFKHYLTLPIQPKEKTRKRNISAMKVILAASALNEETRIDCLGSKLVIAYQEKELEQKTSPVTINARIRFARSLFSRGTLIGYRAKDIAINKEAIEDFFSVGYMKEPEIMPDPPTEEQMALAEQKLPAHAPEWKAYLLAKYGCCRPGEIKAARPSWIVDSVLYIGGRDFVTKSRKWRAVSLPPEVATQLLAGTEGQEFLIGKGRTRVVDRSLPTMLKALGFTSPKPTLSLNKWHVSWRVTNQGIAQAQQSRGHQSPATTLRHYGRVLDLAEPVAYTPPAP